MRCGPAGSQRKFNKRILALGPAVVNDDFIERAVDRYCEFLALARDNPQELVVPTLDIDLIWHAHMLSPQDYHDVRFCQLAPSGGLEPALLYALLSLSGI